MISINKKKTIERGKGFRVGYILVSFLLLFLTLFRAPCNCVCVCVRLISSFLSPCCFFAFLGDEFSSVLGSSLRGGGEEPQVTDGDPGARKRAAGTDRNLASTEAASPSMGNGLSRKCSSREGDQQARRCHYQVRQFRDHGSRRGNTT